jgi:NAD(P)-dependent dehydrogenase (short-subunit alcohol dehydrogenase family)
VTAQTDKRIALVTGASRGIGAAVAERFAREGMHVIITGRNIKGLEATDDAIRATGSSATLVQLDLQEPDKIEQCAMQVAERFGRLDVLVGNAGLLGELSPMAHISPDDWNQVMAVNVTANWHLIRCFDEGFKRSTTPRAIFVTSGVTRRVHPYWGVYAASKAALENMVQTYAAENEKTNLKVNLIDPGATRTRMRAKAYPGEDPDTLPAPEDITDRFVELAGPACTASGQIFNVQHRKAS